MRIYPDDVSGESLRRRTFRWSQIEAGLYAVMVGSAETFAIFFAIKKGISSDQVALLHTLPILLGSIANWIVPAITPQKHLKKFLCAAVAVQCLGLGLTVTAFTGDNFFPTLLTALSLYWIGGMVASPLWLDWISPWLPKERFARYFSRRNAYTSFITVCIFLALSYLLYWKDTESHLLLILSLGFIARSLSLCFLMAQASPVERHRRGESAPDTVTLSDPKRVPSPWKNVLRSPVILSVGIFTVMFKFMAVIASPFTVPYMLNDLHFPLIHYAWITAIPYFGRAMFLASWGEAVRSFRPFVGLQICLIAISGTMSLWASVQSFWGLMATELLAGIFWGGFELSVVLVFQNFAPGRARTLIGAHLAAMNLAALGGAHVGAQLLKSGVPVHDLFVISATGRAIVAFSFLGVMLVLKEASTSYRVYTNFLWTALSLRPSIANIGRIVLQRKA